MKKIILKLIVLLVTIGVIYEGYGMIKELNSNNKVLENVKTIDLFDKRDKTLSIMVQDEGTEFKEATDRSKWPDINTYVYDKAECTNSEGTPVDYKTVLTFNYDNKTTTIKTKNTIYCTLYFVKGKASLQLLQTQGASTFKIQSGMYRFVGTNDQVTHNYICFGTTDLSKCTSNPDEFMYRIIGVTSEPDDTLGLHANQLKLIKAKPLSTSRKWHSANTDIKWDASDMKAYLNGTNSDQFLGAVQWESSDYWKRLITSQKWYNVDQLAGSDGYFNLTDEPKTSWTNTASQIGLMYATDYVNAYRDRTIGNWLFIKNGWTGNPSYSEWTMSRRGQHPGDSRYYIAWYVNWDDGFLYSSWLDNGNSIRPVFYLQPGVLLTGTGTTTDPFRIAG